MSTAWSSSQRPLVADRHCSRNYPRRCAWNSLKPEASTAESSCTSTGRGRWTEGTADLIRRLLTRGWAARIEAAPHLAHAAFTAASPGEGGLAGEGTARCADKAPAGGREIEHGVHADHRVPDH